MAYRELFTGLRVWQGSECTAMVTTKYRGYM